MVSTGGEQNEPDPADHPDKASPDRGEAGPVALEIIELILYVAGQTPKSLTAFANLKKVCDEYLPGRYRIEVIDLMEQPQLASRDQIFAIPTLVRKLPKPIRKLIGDLSNTEKVLVGLQIRTLTP